MPQAPSLQCTSYFSSSSVLSRAFSALCVYSKFGHHPHPLGYLCAKFRFCGGLRCWASPWRKIAYSTNIHPAHLMPREPKLSTRKCNQLINVITNRNCDVVMCSVASVCLCVCLSCPGSTTVESPHPKPSQYMFNISRSISYTKVIG